MPEESPTAWIISEDDLKVHTITQGSQIILEKIQRRTYEAKLVRRKGKLPVLVLPKEVPPLEPDRIKAEADNLFTSG
jgi:hypothetical protein